MGGPASLTVDPKPNQFWLAERVLQNSMELLNSVEALYSRYKGYSTVSLINQRAGSGTFTHIDIEFRTILNIAGQLWEESNGLFDPTVGILNQVWDFQIGRPTSLVKLEQLLEKVGWQNVQVNKTGVHLAKSGMEIDLGGLVKEFAADKIAKLFRNHGLSSALIELAGDIVAIGNQYNGKPWKVGIKNPIDTSTSLCTVNLTNTAICSSGNYERRFIFEGRSVSHLLNPTTGWPTKGPKSVSVIGDSALVAGSISTVACLKSSDDCKTWLEMVGLPWLIVDSDNKCFGSIIDSI